MWVVLVQIENGLGQLVERIAIFGDDRDAAHRSYFEQSSRRGVKAYCWDLYGVQQPCKRKALPGEM